MPARKPAKRSSRPTTAKGRGIGKSARKQAAKAAKAKRATKAKPKLKVSEGAQGNMPVQAYLATLPQWQRSVLQEVDGIIDREVPGVQKAIKWHVPVYGTDKNGWFVSLSAHSRHVKVVFFRGHRLKPTIPAAKGKEMRSIDLREGESVKGDAIASYVRQAAATPGMGA